MLLALLREYHVENLAGKNPRAGAILVFAYAMLVPAWLEKFHVPNLAPRLETVDISVLRLATVAPAPRLLAAPKYE